MTKLPEKKVLIAIIILLPVSFALIVATGELWLHVWAGEPWFEHLIRWWGGFLTTQGLVCSVLLFYWQRWV